MDTLVCLIGLSGSGKTTVAQILEKAFKYNVVKSYTTRAPRCDNEYGHTFTDEEYLRTLNETDLRDEIIAYSKYGHHHYWMLRAQYKGFGQSIYVVDKAGIETLRRKQKELGINLVVIHLHVDTEVRYVRLTEDYKINRAEQYKTEYERKVAVFKRLKREVDEHAIIKCDYSIYNHKSDETAAAIHNILMTINENNVK